MIGLTVAALSVALPLLHLFLSKQPRGKLRVLRILLLYALVLGVGVMGLIFGFIPHIFFAAETAKEIGWAPGSPFQTEVGIHDGAWGVLGFLCIWIGGTFWLATGLGWALFMLGATIGHVYQTVAHGNYAPYNFLMIFSDGFIALWLLLLLFLYWREGGFSGRVA
ncbi:DUF6790 family protein [Methyloligella sp. 2.7D]|uniref:DUF6790 family protein n=1 Tax=unclassified Methyloligella TaxID=2625955 RepID=UPI00157BC118|nr:DUF6790 family protein [Methyloligella sp. GL2]QKP78570.1 hypothetical protein HT051_14675 [Methyloligella sp. GL2]